MFGQKINFSGKSVLWCNFCKMKKINFQFYLFIHIIFNRLHLYDGQMQALHNLTKENSDIAIMTTSQIVDYFNLLQFPKVSVLKTKQYIQAMPYCMYFRKHSSLKTPFNRELDKFASGGLIEQWAKKFKSPTAEIDKTEPKPLSINQFAGLCAICVCLYATSVIVFIFELMSNCHEAIKIAMDFFTFKATAMPRCKFTFFQRNHRTNVIVH